MQQFSLILGWIFPVRILNLTSLFSHVQISVITSWELCKHLYFLIKIPFWLTVTLKKRFVKLDYLQFYFIVGTPEKVHCKFLILFWKKNKNKKWAHNCSFWVIFYLALFGCLSLFYLSLVTVYLWLFGSLRISTR